MNGRSISENEAEASEAPRSGFLRTALPPETKRKKPRILIVDDVAIFRSAVKMTLANYGLSEIDEASGGNAALLKLRSARYDLLICDLLMPHLDGLGLLKELRSDDLLSELPAIVVTGETRRDLVIEAMILGISGYVCKPFKPRALINAVYDALGDWVTDDIH